MEILLVIIAIISVLAYRRHKEIQRTKKWRNMTNFERSMARHIYFTSKPGKESVLG